MGEKQLPGNKAELCNGSNGEELVPILITLMICPAHRCISMKYSSQKNPCESFVALLLSAFCVCRPETGCSLTIPTTSTSALQTGEITAKCVGSPAICFHLSSICGTTFRFSGAELQHQRFLQVMLPRSFCHSKVLHISASGDLERYCYYLLVTDNKYTDNKSIKKSAGAHA